jgi:hypothetical protein
MIHFTGRRGKAGAITAATAAAVGALVLSQAGTTLATGPISRVLHPATVTHTTAGTRLVDSATSNGQCDPSAQLPIVTGGVLTLPGSCAYAQGDSVPPGQNEQQDQECQLTEAQQQELITRAQDQQAAADQAFQSTLLKNLLALAATKASAAALTAQLSGYTGLSPQDVPSLIQNGSVTPADMAAAILQTLQELGESSGDVVIDTCADTQSSDGVAANSSADPQAGGNDQADGQSGSVAPGVNVPADGQSGSVAPGVNVPADGQSGGVAPGVNVPADPLAAAANPNVDLTKIAPTDIVWRTDNDTLYRVDDQTPDQIWAQGFQPRDVNGDYDLNNHVSTKNAGPYVSTTRYAGWYGKSPYFYKIEVPGGIDMDASPEVNANDGEGEVDFPGGIASRYIVGAWKYDANDVQGTWIPNPNFPISGE